MGRGRRRAQERQVTSMMDDSLTLVFILMVLCRNLPKFPAETTNHHYFNVTGVRANIRYCAGHADVRGLWGESWALYGGKNIT